MISGERSTAEDHLGSLAQLELPGQRSLLAVQQVLERLATAGYRQCRGEGEHGTRWETV